MGVHKSLRFMLRNLNVRYFKALCSGLPLISVRFATGCCRSGPRDSVACHLCLIGRAGVALNSFRLACPLMLPISLALQPASASRRHAALRSP